MDSRNIIGQDGMEERGRDGPLSMACLPPPAIFVANERAAEQTEQGLGAFIDCQSLLSLAGAGVYMHSIAANDENFAANIQFVSTYM